MFSTRIRRATKGPSIPARLGNDRGATAVEYGVLVALVAAVSIPALAFGVTQVSNAFAARVSEDGGCAGAACDARTTGTQPQFLDFIGPSAGKVGTSSALTASAYPSGLPVTFESGTPLVCTITGSSVTYLKAQPCTVTAVQVGDPTYAPTHASRSVVVAMGDQAISITSPAAAPNGTVNAIVPVAAAANSGLPVTVTSTTTSVCTIGGTVGAYTLKYLIRGTCTIQANSGGTADWIAAPQATRTVTVAGIAQTITFNAPATGKVPDTITLTATASSGLNVAITSTTTSICTVTGSPGAYNVNFLAAGTCGLSATQAGNGSIDAATPVVDTIAVTKRDQTIAITAPSTDNVGGTDTVTATASSTLTVSVSVAPSTVCTLTGTIVSFPGAGTCTVTATQAGNANWNAAPTATVTIAVGKGDQTIAITAPSTGNVGGNGTVTATASSTLTVSVSVSGVCTRSSTTVTFTGAGTCTVTATQAGNANWNPAPQATATITVAKRNQTIAITAPSTGNVGGNGTVTATASSTLTPVSVVVGPIGVCTRSGTTVTFTGAGTCTVTADQIGDANWNAAPRATATITVGKGDQTIAITAPSTGNVGLTGTVTATASSTLSVSVSVSGVCTRSGTTVTFTGAGTCTVTADQAGDANWNPAPQATATITVTKRNQTITFNAPTSGSVGGTSNLSATATSALPVTFISTDTSRCTVSALPGPQTVTFIARKTCRLTASQGGDGSWSPAADLSVSISVN
jgi:Flp pilus assembly pilin Flp